MTWTRRKLLASLGGAAGGAMLVPLLGPRRTAAATTRAPRRLVIMAMPNGYNDDYYPIAGASETDWTLVDKPDAPLRPLLPHRNDLAILSGISIQNGRDSVEEWLAQQGRQGSLGGHAALPFVLTGARGRPGPEISDQVKLSSGHASIDQYLAARLPDQDVLPFRSLVLRPLRLNGNDIFLSFSGPCLDGNTPNAPAPIDDPRQLYLDLFGADGLDPAQLTRLRAQRKSVLDLSGRQLDRLAAQVGTRDRARVQQHVEATREIERQLDALGIACARPAEPAAGIDYTREFNNTDLPLIIKTQIDLTVAAMSCDLTRVATLLLSNSHNNQYVFPWLADRDPGFADGIGFGDGENTAGGPADGLRHHHSMAHSAEINEGTHRRKNYLDQWFLEQFAYLLDRLSSTPDVDGGRMLDNTVCLFVNLQRTGGGHQTDNVSWLLAGNAGGHFRTQGRYLPWLSGQDGRTVPTNRVLTSIVQAMGLEEDHFADPAYGGALPILHA